MSYAGTSKGGTAAILAAEDLVAAERRAGGAERAGLEQVKALFGATIDRVMGESALWDPDTAAAALLQAGGDLPEAVHLLRAHRSTLPRQAVSEPVDPDDVRLLRRIVPAQRSPEGPQMLGNTADYSARILRRPGQTPALPLTSELAEVRATARLTGTYPDVAPRRFTETLRDRDMLLDREDRSDPDPDDLALNPVSLPASRSALLSAMAMAETGGLIHMWYRSILGPDGYADEHVTLGEVRHVATDVRVRHPHTGQPVVVGEIRLSECEAVAHLRDRGEDNSRFNVGYGMALGHNERKVISMAVLEEATTRYRGTTEGAHLEQLIMLTTDGLASNGFLEHLKLPHYVTFRSQLDRVEAARQEQGSALHTGDGDDDLEIDEVVVAPPVEHLMAAEELV